MKARLAAQKMKADARQGLLGHYGAAIGALLVMVLVFALFSIPFSNMITMGLSFGAYTRVVIGGIGILVVAILVFLLDSGMQWIQLRLARGEEDARFADILRPFQDQPGRYVGMFFLIILLTLICLLPGLLCMLLSVTYTLDPISFEIIYPILFYVSHLILLAGVICWVVIMISWVMARRLLLDHPDMTMMASIRQSRRLMKRKRRRLFWMDLSFLGWFLLSILSFGIALLWVIPYLRQAITCFYLDITEPEPGPDAGEATAF